MVKVLFWRAFWLLRLSVPPLSVVAPLKVFAPVKVTMPGPCTTTAVAPAMPAESALVKV